MLIAAAGASSHRTCDSCQFAMIENMAEEMQTELGKDLVWEGAEQEE